MKNRFIDVDNEMFKGEFYYDFGELIVKEWKSQTVTIPEYITVEDKNIPLYSLLAYSEKPADKIILSSTLLYIKESLLNGMHEVVIPKFCPAFLEYSDWTIGDETITLNRYDNAYYVGNEENPYEYLYKASSNRITKCILHKDTKYICHGAFCECDKLKQLVLNDQLEAAGHDLIRSFNKEVMTEYEGGFYVGSKNNPYYAFVDSDPSYSDVHLHENTKAILKVPDHQVNLWVNENLEFIAEFYFDELEKPQATLHFCKALKGYELYGDDCLCLKKDGLLVRVIGRIDNHVFDGVTKFFGRAFISAKKDKLVIPENITAIYWNGFGAEFKDLYLPKLSSLCYFNILYSGSSNNIFYPGDIRSYVHCHGYNELSLCHCTLYVLNEDGDYVVPEEAVLDEVPDNCLEYVKTIKKVTVEEGVEKIGNYAFNGCENLESVQLPSTLKFIDYNAFAKCTSLKTLIIPEGTEELGDHVFEGCKNLKDVYLPKSIRKISFAILGYDIDDLTVTFHYNGTYEDYLNIEENRSQSVLDAFTSFIGTSTKKEVNQTISCFSRKNEILLSDQYYFFIYDTLGGEETKLKILPVSSVPENANPSYPDSLLVSGKDMKEKMKICQCLDIGSCIEEIVNDDSENCLEDLVDVLNLLISSAYDEMMEAKAKINGTMTLPEYFKSMLNDPARFIQEINALRHQFISQLYEYDFDGEKILLTLKELIKVSGDSYSEYFTDDEILEILNDFDLQLFEIF